MLTEMFTAVAAMSAAGTGLALLLVLIKPLTGKVFGYLWHYYIWLAVLLALLLPVRFQWPDSAVRAFQRGQTQEASAQGAEISQERQAYGLHSPDAGREQRMQDVSSEKVSQGRQAQDIQSADSLHGRLASVAQKIASYTAGAAAWFVEKLDFFAAVWFVGAVFMLAFYTGCYVRFLGKVRRNALPAVYPEMQPYMDKNVRALTCRNISAPFIMGLFRCVLVLPERDLSPAQLQNIWKHEMVHFRRRDILVKWLAVFAKCVHWFNPAVYFIAREISAECEVSCDLTVIKDMDADGVKSYIDTILALLSGEKTEGASFTTGMAGGKRVLRRRFLRMKNRKKTGKIVSAISVAVALLLLSAAVLASGALKTDVRGSASGEMFCDGEKSLPENDGKQAPESHTEIAAEANAQDGIQKTVEDFFEEFLDTLSEDSDRDFSRDDFSGINAYIIAKSFVSRREIYKKFSGGIDEVALENLVLDPVEKENGCLDVSALVKYKFVYGDHEICQASDLYRVKMTETEDGYKIADLDSEDMEIRMVKDELSIQDSAPVSDEIYERVDDYFADIQKGADEMLQADASVTAASGMSGRKDLKNRGCDLLTDKRAECVGDKIYDILHKAHNEYEFADESIVFTQQRESDGMVTLQATYYGTWQLAIPVDQIPQVQGMREAAKELETYEDICAAARCINEQLVEYRGYFKEMPESATVLGIEVRFAEDSAEDAFELYHVYTVDGETKEVLFEDSLSDAETKKQLGREMLQNGLEAYK